LAAIADNSEAPTLENTILALENSGQLLSKVQSVFFNVNIADGDENMKAIEVEYSPRFTAHYGEIYMNEKLFERVKVVYDNRNNLGLDFDDIKLIEQCYKNFVRGGTNLAPDKKTELKAINDQISKLTTEFSQRLIAEANNFKLIVDKKEDLEGLSESQITAAAELAKANKLDGK
jgi:peptidyl-dipeptidase Dcp